MTTTYRLDALGADEFEHLVMTLALRVLGPGATGFAPGPDGGRDGIFVGEAPYPSTTDRWGGKWVIQAKYHSGGGDHSAWLLRTVSDEVGKFAKDKSRQWPDNYIFVTNVEPTGNPRTGSFAKAQSLVAKRRKRLRFDLWGGRKLLDLLALHPDVATQYAHLLTSGHVIANLLDGLSDERASASAIIRHLVATGLTEHSRAKLEQAGDKSDEVAGVHELFTDIPFVSKHGADRQLVVRTMAKAAAETHRPFCRVQNVKEWKDWVRAPARARYWFLKGGPGQGKSTVSQFFCQVQRAAILLGDSQPIPPRNLELAEAIRARAEILGVWPKAPRIPVQIELKDYASWCGRQPKDASQSVLAFLAARLQCELADVVRPGTLRKAFALQRWIFVFDGLDEVSGDVKDRVATEIELFVNSTYSECDSFVVCSSRPQGYSGQFDSIDATVIELAPLTRDEALACARPVIRHRRNNAEAEDGIAVLTQALTTSAVRELMTTPLQSHIMAVIVRSGQHPPEKKWNLYSTFFAVILSREANRNLNDAQVAALLRRDEKLLRAVHAQFGMVLHVEAERNAGAQAELPRERFVAIVRLLAERTKEDDEVESVVQTVKRASEERLVLISTPTDRSRLRYDVRQLQEFFAAEFLYDGASAETLEMRLRVIVGDAHWREVVHFVLSALVEGNRRAELALSVQVLLDLDTDDEPSLRSLARRLARGALVAAKLLADSVLEADKSIRNLFRTVLEPLAYSRRVADVRALLEVRAPASRAFVTNVMTEQLLRSPGEATGAAIFLFEAADPTSSGFASLRRQLETLPPELFLPLVRELGHDWLDRWPAKPWQLEFIATKLSDPAWRETIALMFRLHPDGSSAKAFANVVLRIHGPLVARMWRLHGIQLAEPSLVVKYGSVCVQQQDVDESSLGLIRALAEDLRSAEFSGFLGTLRAAVLHASKPTRGSTAALARACAERWDVLHALPDVLVATCVLPLGVGEDLDGLASRAELWDEDEYQLRCAACTPRRRVSFDMTAPLRLSPGVFAELAREHPSFALHLWLDEPLGGGQKEPSSAGYESVVRDIVLSKPHFASRVFSAAGSILEACHDDAALRSVLQFAGGREPLVMPAMLNKSGIVPFLLNLPEESLVLNLVSGLLANSFLYPHRGTLLREPGAFAKLIEGYVPDSSALRNVVNAVEIRCDARASAAILLAVATASLQPIEDSAELLVCACERAPHVVAAAAAAAFIVGEEGSGQARRILARMFEHAPRTALIDTVLERMLDRWREESLASISSSGCLESWLPR